jgi:hypothetical protein
MRKIFKIIVNNVNLFNSIYKPYPGHGLELLKNDWIFSYISTDKLLNNLSGYFQTFNAEHLAASFIAFLIKKDPDIEVKSQSEINAVTNRIDIGLRGPLYSYLVAKISAKRKPISLSKALIKLLYEQVSEDQTIWEYLVNTPKALQDLKTAVQLNQHHAVLKLLSESEGENNHKEIVLKAVLEAYASKPKSMFRLSCFNRLNSKKRALASHYAKSFVDFNTLTAGLSSEHNNLAEKANKNWFLSNRWKIRTGQYPTADQSKKAWDEREHSELGFIVKSFKKP